MSLIRAKHTKPERVVRSIAHRLGYRFRLHRADLPGKPDLVFAGRSKVVFVHGCFWHLHSGCKAVRLPTSRKNYWLPKLRNNAERDIKARRSLRRAGWKVLVLWECETRSQETISGKLSRFLER
jgi:DNA mismatch endonuclease, patch repair protein